jgi:ferric-dicitrate binding protein FerR (iron transport regulator)
MNPNDDSHETELRRLFAERERRDEAAAPSYERVVARPERKRRGRRRLALAACVAGVVLLAMLAVWKDRSEVAPAPTLSTWKAPTDFLLAVPGGELLNSTPNLPDLRRL